MISYCDWISFSENSRFSFAKSGSNFLVYTDFTSIVIFLTLYIIACLVAACH